MDASNDDFCDVHFVRLRVLPAGFDSAGNVLCTNSECDVCNLETTLCDLAESIIDRARDADRWRVLMRVAHEMARASDMCVSDAIAMARESRELA